MTTLSQDIINTVASELQEWGNEATFQMQKLLQERLKQNAQVSELSQSIDWTGTQVSTNGVIAEWNLNDYYIYIDLGVKGVQNRSKTSTSKEYPTGFKFKNLHISKGFISNMEDYITRKGIKLPANKKDGVQKTWQDRRKALAVQMAKAVKKKGIDATRFYSDVFNDEAFEKLARRISEKIGKDMEFKITSEFKI